MEEKFAKIPDGANSEQSGTGDYQYPFHVTLKLNARFRPLDRGNLEDALQEVLERLGLGEIDGGGTMLQPSGEIKFCDIEINLKDNSQETIDKLLRIIEHFGVPKGSELHAENLSVPVGAQEGLAIYLNGTELPKEVYRTCDINYVVDQMDALMDGVGRMYSYWEGPKDTALYFYGSSYEEMYARVAGFAEEYPLCQKCIITKIA